MIEHQPASPRYIDAALELLDAHGSADPTLGITIGIAATGSAVTRSTIYRYWDSVGDLNDDVARFSIAYGRTWQTRWLEQPFDDPTDQIVERVLGPADGEFSIMARSAVASWPLSSKAREDIAAWEWDWLHAFGNWLDAHIRAQAKRPADGTSPLVMALAVTGYIEGALILTAMVEGLPIPNWCAVQVPKMAAAIERLLNEFAKDDETINPPDPPDLHIDPLPMGEQQRDRMDRAWTLRAGDFLNPDLLPSAGRAVDMGRLARKLDVTERVLYRTWPTSQSMNIDLFAAVLERHRQDTSRIVSQTFSVGLSELFDSFDQLLISATHAIVAAAAAPRTSSHFIFATAAIDPDVRQHTTRIIEEWRAAERTTFLAMMAMCGWYRRPNLPAEDFTSTTFDSIAGLQRLVALNPRLLDEQQTFRDIDQSVIGLATYWVARSLSSPEAPGLLPDAEPATAPAIDPHTIHGSVEPQVTS